MDDERLFLEMMEYWMQNISTASESLGKFFSQGFRQELLENIQDSLRLRSLPDRQTRSMARQIWDSMLGLSLLNRLLEDPKVSDIKFIAHNQIRLKSLGVRRTSSYYFQSQDQYLHFVEYILLQNGFRLADTHSALSFCDMTSRSEDILCYHISSRRINSANTPYLHLRRIPKKKKHLKDLVKEGMITADASDCLTLQAKNGGSILLTGTNSKDLQTLMNALLDLIPHDCSALAIQEKEELFSLSHPEIMFQHTAPSTRSQVPADSRFLMENGLLLDSDYFILDELTQENALPFWRAITRGCHCWTCLPAPDANAALIQLADYLCQETFTPRDLVLTSLNQISCVVCLKDKKLAQLVRIIGWDGETKHFILQDLTAE